jgi:hypothetical protein
MAGILDFPLLTVRAAMVSLNTFSPHLHMIAKFATITGAPQIPDE